MRVIHIKYEVNCDLMSADSVEIEVDKSASDKVADIVSSEDSFLAPLKEIIIQNIEQILKLEATLMDSHFLRIISISVLE